MKITYNDKDLKGLMDIAAREKQSSSQVPTIIQEQMVTDTRGKEEKQTVFSQFILGIFYFIRLNRKADRFLYISRQITNKKM